MALRDLNKLAALVRDQKEPLLARWREQVRDLPSAKDLDVPTLNDHIPMLLEELAAAFEAASDESIPQALLGGSPPIHGEQREQDGYDIVEVVAEYNILRGCLHDLAEAAGLALRGKSFHILNRVLDGAIGLAVQTFAAQRALEVQRRREEYLALVAHDLRTPLSAVSLAAGVLDLAFAGGTGGPQVERMLKTLHRNVRHLSALVETVLKENANVTAESGIKLERRDLDLWPIVEATVHGLEPVAGSCGTRLVNAVPVELTAYADAGLLRRVFQNLIANAIGYTPRGDVVIAAEAAAAGGVECRVTDTGAGIAPEMRDKIFDKYETDPAVEGGVGLGLAIVKSFVEAHGGHVTVESEVGAGTTFRFTLPGRSAAA